MHDAKTIETALKGYHELFTMALRRGMFASIDENSEHLGHLSVMTHYLKLHVPKCAECAESMKKHEEQSMLAESMPPQGVEAQQPSH